MHSTYHTCDLNGAEPIYAMPSDLCSNAKSEPNCFLSTQDGDTGGGDLDEIYCQKIYSTCADGRRSDKNDILASLSELHEPDSIYVNQRIIEMNDVMKQEIPSEQK